MTTRRDSGRKGGMVTLRRYGRAQLAEWGRLGGRPRARTYDDIRQQRLRGRQNNNEEVQGSPGGDNLALLTKSVKYRLRRRSSGDAQIDEAGTVPETPRGRALPERT